VSAGPLTGLRAVVRGFFWDHVARLREAGLDPDPDLELREIDGIFAFCDTATGHVHIGVADGEGDAGALQIVYLQSLFGIDDLDELDFFVRAFLPWTPAHELGHHLRVRHRRFGDGPWWEEQIANRVARATVGPSLGGDRRGHLAALMRRVIAATDQHGEGWSSILDSYDDVLPPESVTLDPRAGEWITVDDPRAPEGRLARRRALIARFDREHGRDEVAYLRRQLGWIYLAMHDPRPISLDAIARAHLVPRRSGHA
jgi:hypothetical protein